jgi:flagellin-like protein
VKAGLRAISPVIATVIILAVTIAIAIAVVGWVTGLFGATTSGTATLQVLSDSYLYSDCNGTNIVVVHLRNTGSATAHVYRIEIRGVGSSTSLYASNTFDTSNPSSIVSGSSTNSVAISPGNEKYVAAEISGTITPGTVYTIYVYVKETGTPLSTTLVAQQCPS